MAYQINGCGVTASIIIPTFNHGGFLREAIDSVRRQTWRDWECIVVDDGSTDDTRTIVDEVVKLDKRIRYVWQENLGLPAARNLGLAKTSGEFIQFLDADDVLGPAKLARQLGILTERSGIDIVYGDWRYFADSRRLEGRPVRRWRSGPALPSVSGNGQAVLKTLVLGNAMVVEAPLVRRAILERVGGFDQSLRRLEDWECWLRCAAAGARFFHDRSADVSALAFVRIHPGSMSDDRLQMLETALEIRQTLSQRLPSASLRRLNQMEMHRQWAEIGILQGLGDHPAVGRQWLLRAAVAERRMRWLLWALLIPAFRRRPGRWVLDQWWRLRSRRTHSTQSRTIRPTIITANSDAHEQT